MPYSCWYGSAWFILTCVSFAALRIWSYRAIANILCAPKQKQKTVPPMSLNALPFLTCPPISYHASSSLTISHHHPLWNYAFNLSHLSLCPISNCAACLSGQGAVKNGRHGKRWRGEKDRRSRYIFGVWLEMERHGKKLRGMIRSWRVWTKFGGHN